MAIKNPYPFIKKEQKQKELEKEKTITTPSLTLNLANQASKGLNSLIQDPKGAIDKVKEVGEQVKLGLTKPRTAIDNMVEEYRAKKESERMAQQAQRLNQPNQQPQGATNSTTQTESKPTNTIRQAKFNEEGKFIGYETIKEQGQTVNQEESNPGNQNALVTGDFSEEQIDNKMNQGYAEAKAGADYFGVLNQLNITQDKKDLIQRTVELNNDFYQFNMESLAYMEEQELEKLNKYKAQAEAVSSANKANLAQSREGVQASANSMAMAEYDTAIKKDLESKTKTYGRAMEELSLKRREYELAKENGDTELAKSLGAELSLAQDQLYQAETRLLDSNERWVNQMLATSQNTRANIDTFTGMIANGQQFDTSSLLGIASELGLPSEMVISTYQSMDAIRQDKNLSLEQKQLQTQEVKRDFDMRLNGFFTEQQQSAKIFTEMFKSGKIDEKTYSEMITNAGISSQFNYVQQAQLRNQQLQNQILYNEANGIPVNNSQRYEQMVAQAQIDAITGAGGTAYVNNENEFGINSSFENGYLEITGEGVLKPMQCGEFVNRFWGLPNGGNGGMPSLAKDKRAVVDSRGVSADYLRDNPHLLKTLVRPGMAFVSKFGDTDHTGIVTYVNSQTGEIHTKEANIGDNNPYKSDPPKDNIRNINDADLYGFAPPPNGVLSEGKMTQASPTGEEVISLGSMDGDTRKELLSFNDDFQNETVVKEFEKATETYSNVVSAVNNPSGPSDVAVIFQFMKTLDPTSVVREGEFDKARETGSIFQGAYAKFNKLLTGEDLSPSLRQDFLRTSQDLLKNKHNIYKQKLNTYSTQINSIAGGNAASSVLRTIDDSFIQNFDKENDPLGISSQGVIPKEDNPLGI